MQNMKKNVIFNDSIQPAHSLIGSFPTSIRVKFRTALVELDEWNIWATFEDGFKNQFWLPGVSSDYANIALDYGYDDKRRYAYEHELAHHFLADNLGMKYSWSVHDGASFEDRPDPKDWPNHVAWEENLVNAFQAHAHAGMKDKWGTLHCVFPENKLRAKTQEFLDICGKALDERRNIMYHHETGYVRYI